MKLAGARKQTLFLTTVNAAVRALGLGMRICMSRLLGAEVMGIMELAQSVHMVAIAPLTSGLPPAVSRLTARADHENREQALASGLWLARTVSLLLVPLLWLLSPLIARWMGDVRVMPSLWFTAPCILILGYSAAYNGYCYGLERSDVPAISELIEQLIRFSLTLVALKLLRHLASPWLAAVPVASTMTAEIIGLIYVLHRLSDAKPSHRPSASWNKAVFRLSAPSTATRIMQTLLRSLTAILIPMRLQASGLPAAEATAQLGMLNGMVMPILMLPGIFTSALSMVMVPRIAKAEEKPSELGRLLRLCVYSSMPISVLFAVLVYCCAPFMANVLYRQAELSELFRLSAFQLLLFPLNHLIGSTLSALGQQRRSLVVSCITALVTLVMTWLFAGEPLLRIKGIICAQYMSQLISVTLGFFMLLRWRSEHRAIRGDKSA